VPAEGDVRLVPLNGTTVATAPCDDVHFGGVELFHEGRWGRICSSPAGGRPEDFTLDALVVCRQLGFPFGTVMDSGDKSGVYDVDYYALQETLVWATEVRPHLERLADRSPDFHGHRTQYIAGEPSIARNRLAEVTG